VEASKIVFSEAEHQLITNAEVILTKNRCIDKIVELFSGLADDYRKSAGHLIPIAPGIFSVHPKISKGEKHLDLPWVMLDYPRCFDKVTGHLAIRTFFWWGNFFSIHLQASGKYFQPVADALLNSNIYDDWMGGITTDPWDMQLPNRYWQPIEINAPTHYVIKIAKKNSHLPMGICIGICRRF
jgi:hypothetical protein